MHEMERLDFGCTWAYDLEINWISFPSRFRCFFSPFPLHSLFVYPFQLGVVIDLLLSFPVIRRLVFIVITVTPRGCESAVTLLNLVTSPFITLNSWILNHLIFALTFPAGSSPLDASITS